MCGIYGEISFSGPARDKREILESLNTLTHRGPDDYGFYQNYPATLAHRRLSIIDLSTGHQPIPNEDQTIWCICNGEIYNYRALTEQLKSKGHRFSTKSDSEVIIHLYEEYQEEFVKKLNGIFSFALWDDKQKKLVLARDQLGVKPLFYYSDSSKLIFSSEIKAILKHTEVKREVDSQSIYNYFSLNYIPAPATAFKNISALLPGHICVIQNKHIRIQQYWDVQFDAQLNNSPTQIARDLRDLVEDSVKRQLVSDVPVGTFLSGGLDSTIVTYLAAKHYPEKIKTFNVRFKEDSFDESSYAKLAARTFQTEHFEIFCEADDYKKYLPEIIMHADNLTADISMLPLYLVSKLAHQHVKVVLAGDGADELFAGYPTYQADRLLQRVHLLPSFMRNQWLPSLVNALPVSHKKMSFEFKAKRFMHGAQLTEDAAHCAWRLIFNDHERELLLSQDVLQSAKNSTFSAFGKYYEGKDQWERLSRHQYVDVKTWMVDSILSKVDLMSMTHALEVRVPLLNSELVEFSAKIPCALKLKGAIPKYILKKAFENDIPKPILNRAKAGFNIPIGHWFRHELKDMVQSVLSERNVRAVPVLNVNAVNQLVAEHSAGKKDNSYKLLSLMHFVLWYERFIKSNDF